MTVWIVVSILAVVLSPLAWLRPSRRQSGLIALRMEARRMGLAMQLAPQEWPHWLGQEPPNPCPQYHRPRRSGQPVCWSYWQIAPGNWVNQWREPCVDESLLKHFQALPAGVFKVEADKQMIALYWNERGEVSVLQDIASVLKALA
ncbi:hypothetical protein D3X12_14530 [Pseudomonas protegens]|uniref:Uncharacterized protein n=2 Tax=Pseudomonas protegens TaxID=380021 RepID=Q4KFC5_PSEF5|nr:MULTISPECIES: hypothetical protein [Pseudomonas]AAY91226.1 conserved hypothetical protein [Pseudomonas protegens Pf-5]ASE24517.1 hypothetical protein CEP86_30250 [Pseudomonas protegens]MCD9572079.1 hypothetical protein [Pseudomonas protegens]POA91895.1 hypothetical protein C1883_02305 [Pseudomonas protegens]QEZ51844.1 hypothetical protein D3X12_14530 [Pseudomonas protegens]